MAIITTIKQIKKSQSMTRLGEYLLTKSTNKAVVARKTGLSKQRMGEITLNTNAKLRAEEVYRIALAIGVKPAELFEYVCEGIELKNTPNLSRPTEKNYL